MGYRSDVKLITTKEGWKRIDKAVKKVCQIDNEDNWYLTREDNWVFICGGKYILAEWEDIKWYDWGDRGVSAIMEELEKFEKDNIPYELMRIGENWGDVESKGQDTYYCPEYDDMPNLMLKREIEVIY